MRMPGIVAAGTALLAAATLVGGDLGVSVSGSHLAPAASRTELTTVGPADVDTDLNVVTTADGTDLVAWTVGPRHDRRLHVRVRPAGGSWQRARELGRVGFDAMPLVADGAGGATLAWVRPLGGAETRLFVSTYDRGWRTHAIATGPSLSAPSLAVAATGRAVLAWTVFGRRIEAAARPAGGAWGAPVTLDIGRRLGTTAVGVDERGRAVALWDRSGRLHRAHLVDGGWLRGSPLDVSGDASDPAIVVRPDGSAVAAWRGHSQDPPRGLRTVALAADGTPGPPAVLGLPRASVDDFDLDLAADGRVAVALVQTRRRTGGSIVHQQVLGPDGWQPLAVVRDLGRRYSFDVAQALGTDGVPDTVVWDQILQAGRRSTIRVATGTAAAWSRGRVVSRPRSDTYELHAGGTPTHTVVAWLDRGRGTVEVATSR